MSSSISKLNVSMGMETSGLEAGARRAENVLRKLSQVQAEALKGESGGPDFARIIDTAKRMRESSGRVSMGEGDSSRLVLSQKESLAIAEEIGRRRERFWLNEQAAADRAATSEELRAQRLKDAALTEQQIQTLKAQQAQATNVQLTAMDGITQKARESAAAMDQQLAIQEAAAQRAAQRAATSEELRAQRLKDAALTEQQIQTLKAQQAQSTNAQLTAMVGVSNAARESAAAMDQQLAIQEAAALRAATSEELRAQRLKDAALTEQQIQSLKAQQAQTTNAQLTAMDGITKKARESAAVFEQQFSLEQKIADLRARTAQIRSSEKMERMSPFTRQVAEVRRLRQLMVERRNLQRGTVEFAQKELEITRQIANVRSMRSELSAGSERMRKLGTTAKDSQKKFARFGLQMQQSGYQVQDFVVQVTSGTNALVALSQQGSQLLGFFGGWKGAVAGAALAIGVLGIRMFQAKNRVNELKSGLDSMTAPEVLKRIIELRKEVDLLLDPSKAAAYSDVDIRRATNAYNIQAGVVRRLEESLKALETQREALTGPESVLSEEEQRSAVIALNSQVGRLTKSLKTQSEELGKLQVPFNEATNAQKALDEEIRKTIQSNREASMTGWEIQQSLAAQKKELEDLGRTHSVEYQRIIGQQQAYARAVAEVRRANREATESEDEKFDRMRRAARELPQGSVEQAEAEGEVRALSRSYADLLRANDRFGESNVITFRRLRDELDRTQGQMFAYERTLAEFKGVEQALNAERDAILDQLDPLRSKRRELERIRELQEEGFFGNDRDVAAEMGRRMRDEMERSLRIPSAFEMSTGSSQAGARNVASGINDQRKILNDMLRQLESINKSVSN